MYSLGRVNRGELTLVWVTPADLHVIKSELELLVEAETNPLPSLRQFLNFLLVSDSIF